MIEAVVGKHDQLIMELYNYGVVAVIVILIVAAYFVGRWQPNHTTNHDREEE